jgi:hypothetical protein
MQSDDAATRPTAEELYEEIRLRAFEIYLDRMARGEEGDALTDWLAAEMDVANRHNRAEPPAVVSSRRQSP